LKDLLRILLSKES
jgi:Ca2+-binding EF-hand superfamily protein